MKPFIQSVHYLLLAFAFFLPLNEKISTLLIVATVITVIIGLLLKKISFNTSSNKMLLFLPVLFLIYVASLVFFSENADFKFIESKLSLLAFPLIFSVQLNIIRQKILRSFVFGCALAYFICLGNSVLNSFVLENGEYIFKPLLSDSRTFFEAIVFEGNHFFGKYFSSLHHTSYFAIYQVFSIVILLNYRKYFKKWLFFTLISIFSLGIIQTMSMAGFGSLMIIILIFTFINVRSKKLKMFFLVSVLAIIIAALMFHPRLKNLVNDLTNKEVVLNPDGMDGVMLRLLSWDASLKIIYENPIFGVGIGDAQEALNTTYENNAYIQPLKRKLNAHNQYLQLYIETGIWGFVMVFCLIITLLKKAKVEKYQNKIMIISFTALIVFNFMFESYFSRFVGISFFSFFCCLLTSSFEKER
jgi:O-antigen ligase